MAKEQDDFREVAHCGGQVTFSIKTDDDGVRSYSMGYRASRPNAMAFFAVYALPDGLACGDIQLGGVGTPWNPPPYPHCVAVFIGSDSHGRFGHQCPECDRYWRSSGAPSRWRMSCPYCGVRGATWQFLTPAQQKYVSHYCATLMKALSSDEKNFEVVIDLDAASDAALIDKPDFYYAGQTQQTKFLCGLCNGENDIKGQYGYCSTCGTRNNAQMLSDDLDALRGKLNDGSTSPADGLKMAVSAFDSCCRNLTGQLVERVPLTAARQNRLKGMLFHGVEGAQRDVKAVFDIDLFDRIPQVDIAFVRMMFQRRHAFEHDGGHATHKYISESGDTSVAEGALIRENRENVHRLIGLLNRMAGNFSSGFHDLFPPEEKPAAYAADFKQRQQRRGT